jgi:uncharacterized protein YbjT (DUF2867 family)
MRLLVTGGSGFLGEYVLTEAARRGHETVALARSDAAAVTVTRRAGQSLTGDLDDLARLLGLFGTRTSTPSSTCRRWDLPPKARHDR